ncbi:12523_t:CDS:1 [Entrophospora sp. SA101]|nr:7814_t:CDS:1 [Entrophospora sp. SA101]CAJ0842480.1 12523_t:CDS:1 [Entrophospora sp. SA101]
MNVIDEELRYATKIISNLKDCNKSLQDECSSRVKSFDWERKTWALERKGWDRELVKTNNEIQKLRDQALGIADVAKQLRSENTNLISQNARKNLSLADSKAKITAKINEIKMLQGKIKSLKGELDLSQKESSKKESKISSFKSNLAELERIKEDLISKVSELEHLKLVTISRNLSNQVELPSGEAKLRTSDSSIIGGGDEGQSTIAPTIKNIANSDVISAVDKPKPDFSKFLKHRKNMDQTERIDVHQFSDTINKANNEAKPQIPDSSRSTNMKSSISEGSHVDTSQIVEIKDFSEDTVSKTDFITRRVAPEGPGNDQSHTIKTEMAEILPVGIIPIVGSNLFSPKFMYAVLAFLILAVIWW